MSGLSASLKLNNWKLLKAIYSQIKEIAETARREYRRKEKTLSSLVIVEPIKKVIAPLSRIINHKQNDNSCLNLLSEAIAKLNLLALELERFNIFNTAKVLRSIAEKLFNLIPSHTPVQLELFEASDYQFLSIQRKVFDCFRRWLNKYNDKKFERDLKRYLENPNYSYYQDENKVKFSQMSLRLVFR